MHKVFTKTGRSLWLRGDSALGPQCNKLRSTICIVLLSEFVSRNVWLQQYQLGFVESRGGKFPFLGDKLTQKDDADSGVQFITPAGPMQRLLLAKDPDQFL